MHLLPVSVFSHGVERFSVLQIVTRESVELIGVERATARCLDAALRFSRAVDVIRPASSSHGNAETASGRKISE